MPRLSVVLTVCNEAHVLEECLNSVRWADEIVVVDMHSSDGSSDIYRRYTDRVFLYPREIIADPSHRFGFSKATGDWILKMDPDERVLPSLADDIRRVVAQDASEYAAYRLPFKDYIFGKWIQHSGWQTNREPGLIRLFRTCAVTWPDTVHAVPDINGAVGRISYDYKRDNAVQHLNYVDLNHFIEKLNRYTTAEASRLHRLQRPYHPLKLFYQPSKEFVRRYLAMQGYRDGMHGLVLSLLQAFYVMVSYMKLWELETQETRHGDSEASAK